jgi:hypothetical protein
MGDHDPAAAMDAELTKQSEITSFGRCWTQLKPTPFQGSHWVRKMSNCQDVKIQIMPIALIIKPLPRYNPSLVDVKACRACVAASQSVDPASNLQSGAQQLDSASPQGWQD